MRFDHLSAEHGLAQNSVMAIQQDATGFMWFATESGVDRYDGHRFTHFRSRRQSAGSLPADYVPAIELDYDGGLWIATDGGGIAKFEPATGTFRRFGTSDGLADDKIQKLVADPRGYLWVGTLRDGLDRLTIDGGAVEHFSHADDDVNSLPGNDVRALWLDGDGTVWVGTNSGLARVSADGKRIERFVNDPSDPTSLSGNRIRAVLRDSLGTLWVGTQRAGLNRYDGERGFARFRADDTVSGALSHDRVETLLEDDSGRIWIGTADGLNLFDRKSGSFTTYRRSLEEPSSISDNYVISLYQDRSGILWVGTKTGGLSKWNPRTWSFGHYRPSPGADGDFRVRHVTSFAAGHDDSIWFGTFGAGLVRLAADGSVAERLSSASGSDGLSDDRVMALLRARNGDLWVGTMGGGLNRIDATTGRIENFRHDRNVSGSLAANGVMSLFEDSRGRLWVGTFGGGVDRYDTESGRFLHFPHDPDQPASLSSPRATAIGEDRNGNIWVGTDGGGLNRLRADERWEHFEASPDGLSSNTIYSLHLDRKGNFWAGTREGLNRVAPVAGNPARVRFSVIAEEDGLADGSIYGIQSDSENRIWVSTNRGLSVYDPISRDITNYSASLGLQAREFNFGAHYRASNGTLYFGGPNGFNAFVPKELSINSTPPPVALVGLEKLNKPIRADGNYGGISSVELEHTDDVVTFEFAALDFAAPEENRYAYQLEGFDDGWVEAGTTRRTTYTNLDAGDYTFRVRAANSDGVWSEAALNLDISVAAPPWKTWWAYLLYVLSALSLMAWFVYAQQLKLRREEQYSRRLEQEVGVRTQELAERNGELQEANEKLHEASNTDALTGLRNRRYFFHEIGAMLDRMEWPTGDDRRAGGVDEFVFLMVDLDHFKPVNDTHGHEAGDNMLKSVSAALLKACRSSDTVIRWGGDEFLVVARRTGVDEASRLAERVRDAIASTVFPLGNNHVARTTSSIGFAAFPFFDDDPQRLGWEQVLKVADLGMYRAKQERNAWCGVIGVDYEASADALLEALHDDIDELSELGHVILVESRRECAEMIA